MEHRTRRVVAALFAALVISSATAAVASAHAPSGDRLDLLRAAIATARFHSTAQATSAGYGPFPAGVPLHECISSLDNTGAMGFHWLNAANLTTNLDPTKPQVLVYAPDRRGNLHLVALEYVVFQSDWKAAHGDTTPMLFGQMFMATGEPNRYQIPAFYSLHVWLWRYNPSGLYAPFNPDVSCDPGSGGHAGPWWDGRADVDRDPLAASRAQFVCTMGSSMQM